jgi:hypothetical protein
MNLSAIALFAVCLLFLSNIAQAVECDSEGYPTSREALKQLLKEGATPEQAHQLCTPPNPALQSAGLIVGVICQILLLPPLTAGMWDVERRLFRRR